MIERAKLIQDKQVLIGQPLDYPYELISIMQNSFAKINEVKKAYLACVQYPNPNFFPKILIGLEHSGKLEEIISRLEFATRYNEKFINLVEFANANESPFKEYFLKISPFYIQNKLK